MGKSVRLAVLLALWGAKAIFAQSASNPGFEAGSIAPWMAYIPGTGSITVGTTSHSGSYGLSEGPNSAAEVAYQDIYGLTPGQSYVVSVWVKASASGGTVSLYLDDTQGNNYQGTPAITPPTTSWQQISQLYPATSNGAMCIHLVEQPGSETTYWDDVTITPVPPVNPGFETGSIAPWRAYIPGTGSITVGTTSHSGSYGLSEGPNSAAEVAYQDIYGLTPGQSYVVSVWVKASASGGTVSLYLDDTQGNNYQGTPAITPPTTGWQQISQLYPATSHCCPKQDRVVKLSIETTGL